jgi:hypothetical protein
MSYQMHFQNVTFSKVFCWFSEFKPKSEKKGFFIFFLKIFKLVMLFLEISNLRCSSVQATTSFGNYKDQSKIEIIQTKGDILLAY